MLIELDELARTHPNARRFSREMLELGYALNAISARCYRHLCSVFPFPSVRTVFDRFQPEKMSIPCALSESPNLVPLKNHIREFRDREQLPEGLIPCTLAFDATSVTKTRLPDASHKGGSAFAFLRLPLDHRIPDLLIRSVARPHGRMTKEILPAKTELCDILRQCGFPPHVVATDGDSKMDQAHADAFEEYRTLYGLAAGGLRAIVRLLDANGRVMEW
jgi:hypothetical protein